ncbi:MAG: hypothetical protein JNK60_17705 [Acidobacteria bacterium]|nr:hypothetical protein [Acidobacteriota bacterium]
MLSPLRLTFLASVMSAASLSTAALCALDRPPEGALGRRAIRVFTDRDGLPQNSVESFAFDRQGFLWLATRDGAAVYDGRTFRIVNMPTRKASNWVRAVLAAPDGSVYFGTEGGGLHRLRNGAFTSWNRAHGLPGDNVRALGLSGGGVIVGTDAGAAQLTGDSLLVTQELEAVRGKSVLSVGELRGRVALGTATDGVFAGGARLPGRLARVNALFFHDGALLAGSDTGLFRFTEGPTDPVAVPGFEGVIVRSLSAEGDDLLVGTEGRGLLRLGAGHATPLTVRSGLPSDIVFHAQARNGQLWIGTLAGLARETAGDLVAFDSTQGLPNDSVVSLLETRTGEGDRTLYLGTAGGGLAALANGAMRVYGTASGLPDPSVFALLQADGRLFAGTGKGLSVLVGERFVNVKAEPPLPAEAVVSLLSTLERGNRVIYAGTYGAGLFRLEWSGPERPARSTRVELPDGRVEALLLVSNPDRIVIATNAGAVILDPATNERFVLAPPELPNAIVRSLWASGGSLFLGTGGGLVETRLGKGKPEVLRLLDTTTSPALPNDTVYRLEAASGQLFAMTGRGIARVQGAPRTWDSSDGLPSNECNFGASTVDADGRLWIGTPRGAAVLDPRADRRPPRSPLVVKAAHGPSQSPRTPGLSLPHDARNVTFELTLLSFRKEEGTLYRTELVGLGTAPSDWTPDPHRLYATLPPGDYVFRAWGRDGLGVESAVSETAFTVRQAPWATWPARLLFLALAAGAVWAVVRIRLARLESQTRRLEAAVAERTRELVASREEALEASRAKSLFLANMSHELRTPLNAILGYAELIEEESDERERSRHASDLARIRAAAQHQLQLVNSVLDLSKIEAGKMELVSDDFLVAALVRDVASLVPPLVARNGNRFVLEGPPEDLWITADATKLRQSLLNLLSNAAKFTENGVVALRVSVEGPDIVFRVSDTGIGMTPEELAKLFQPFVQADASTTRKYGGTGLGLALTKRFAELLGGSLVVDSTRGVGTTMTLRIPKAGKS